jgi:DNA-directed RNA polymerase subunit RPC12/RpoP
MSKIQLWVTCKSCGREFDTHVRIDRKSFERGTLAANYHLCPHCGQRRTYAKADYRPKDALPTRSAPSPPAGQRGTPSP